MLQPISQNNLSHKVYPNFKNTPFQNPVNEKPYFLFEKKFERIKTDDDFRKAQLDQAERSIVLSTVTFFTLLMCAVMFMLGRGKSTPAKKQVQDLTDIYFKGFESLKNNPKVPLLENCKSINKELREILEIQVKQSKAGDNITKETGEAVSSNRLLLFGPAGVGKSFFAKIYAKSLDAEYTEVLYSDFNSKWSGESVENLKYIFEKILAAAGKNPQKKYVVTFNEIDTIVMPPENLARGSGHVLSKLEDRSVFLNYMDRLNETAPNVTVIGTTNISPKNNGLDRAAMSRFQNIVEVPYPDKECLFEALKMNLKGISGGDIFIAENERQLKKLAETMAARRFSFRNLENTVNQAKQYYKIEVIDSGKNEGFKFDYLKRGENSIKLSDGELERP